LLLYNITTIRAVCAACTAARNTKGYFMKKFIVHGHVRDDGSEFIGEVQAMNSIEAKIAAVSIFWYASIENIEYA